MATNEPFVPSMIFKSRTTNALSNVTEQKACSRSFSLPSSMSLMRISVITTVVLLYVCGTLKRSSHDERLRGDPLLGPDANPMGDPKGFALITAKGEHASSTATEHLARGTKAR